MPILRFMFASFALFAPLLISFLPLCVNGVRACSWLRCNGGGHDQLLAEKKHQHVHCNADPVVPGWIRNAQGTEGAHVLYVSRVCMCRCVCWLMCAWILWVSNWSVVSTAAFAAAAAARKQACVLVMESQSSPKLRLFVV